MIFRLLSIGTFFIPSVTLLYLYLLHFYFTINTPQEVFKIVIKDKTFYDEANGGLTISGGEALSHIDFCIELLKLCKEQKIHTCIETC